MNTERTKSETKLRLKFMKQVESWGSNWSTIEQYNHDEKNKLANQALEAINEPEKFRMIYGKYCDVKARADVYDIIQHQMKYYLNEEIQDMGLYTP